MGTIPYRNISVSSMRKLATGAWDSPKDPSVCVQLDLPVTQLMAHLPSTGHLKYALIKLVSLALHHVPELNTAFVRGKLRQRVTCRVFIPTLIRHQKKVDLSGVFIDNAQDISLSDIQHQLTTKVSELRSGKDVKTHRAIRIFNSLPFRLSRIMVGILNFVHYTCNVSLAFFGLPNDPFGSITLTFLDKFNVRYASIPIYPFSRTPMAMSMGAVYEKNRNFFCPITVTFDHRHFDGYHAAKAYKLILKCLKCPVDQW
jgi:pyruvate/2-oxoglutarate dehydrogenase complex dihydrolipoamide acyltransferase (E2) component